MPVDHWVHLNNLSYGETFQFMGDLINFFGMPSCYKLMRILEEERQPASRERASHISGSSHP